MFLAHNGQEYDIYELIVKSIAENPPIMKLEFEDVKERIYSLIKEDGKKPSPQTIKESLAKLQELLDGREDIFKVLDWKRGSIIYTGSLVPVLFALGRRHKECLVMIMALKV